MKMENPTQMNRIMLVRCISCFSKVLADLATETSLTGTEITGNWTHMQLIVNAN